MLEGVSKEGAATSRQQSSAAAGLPAWAGPVLSVGTGAALLGVLAVRLGAGPFLQGLSRATPPALVLALAIGAATTVLSALRWVRAARLLGLPLTAARAVSDYYAALFLNSVLPGGVLGDVRRAALHGRDAGRVGAATGALLLERFAGQLVLVVAAAAVWLVDPSVVPGPAPVWRAVAVVLAVAGLGAALAVARRFARMVLRLHVRDVAAMLGASAVALCGHVAMFVLAARAAGVDMSLVGLLPLAMVALLAMSLPLNLAGWGPREGATAWAFAGAGLGAGQGVTVAVLYGVFALVAGLPGAVVLLGRRSVPTDRVPEPGREPVPQQHHVVQAPDVGQHRPLVAGGGEPPRPRQTGGCGLADQEGRDGDLQLVDDAGMQAGREDDLPSLDEQAANAPVVEVGQH